MTGIDAVAAPSLTNQSLLYTPIDEFGLNLPARKLSVRPCNDSYVYADGTWTDRLQTADDFDEYCSSGKVSELSGQRVRDTTDSRRSLSSHLVFHFVDQFQLRLRALDHEAIAFYRSALSGASRQALRWKRGVQSFSKVCRDVIGHFDISKDFSPKSKAEMEQLAAQLRIKVRERMDAMSWITLETKKGVQQRLAFFKAKMRYSNNLRYSNKLKEYIKLRHVRGDATGNDERAALWESHRDLFRLDQRVDCEGRLMPVSEIVAGYNAQDREMALPAALLQPSFFDPNADGAVNYGEIDSVAGREIGYRSTIRAANPCLS